MKIPEGIQNNNEASTAWALKWGALRQTQQHLTPTQRNPAQPNPEALTRTNFRMIKVLVRIGSRNRWTWWTHLWFEWCEHSSFWKMCGGQHRVCRSFENGTFTYGCSGVTNYCSENSMSVRMVLAETVTLKNLPMIHVLRRLTIWKDQWRFVYGLRKLWKWRMYKWVMLCENSDLC